MNIRENFKPARQASRPVRFLRIVVRILLVQLFLRYLLVEAYTEQGMAMLPNIVPGDRVLCNRFVYGIRIPPFRAVRLPSFSSPARGDLVFYHHPWQNPPAGLGILLDYLSLGLLYDSGKSLCSGRIVAAGGDLVRLDGTGRLYRNGRLVTGEAGAPLPLEVRQSGGDALLLVNGIPVYRGPAAFPGREAWRRAPLQAAEAGYRVLLNPADRTNAPFPEDNNAVPGAFESFVRSFLRHNLVLGTGEPVTVTDGPVEKKETIQVWKTAEGGVSLRHPDREGVLRLVVRKDGALWLQVPEDHYFILNDNRAIPADSRSWGLVTRNRIEGSLLFRISPTGGRRPLP